MGGKSTYLRQTALIPILAQIGSFVPAREAKVPLVDRIFARVGASDNIARGQSTFMVEMQETANILHSATSRSLVVLDEIGRGTSTFDGSEHRLGGRRVPRHQRRARPKTLFATHYHELTDLADALPGIVNAHVAAREWKDDIIFLRKIVPGRADRSYGIQVARLAGLPAIVVDRAKEILQGLERDELSRGGRPTLSGTRGGPETYQMGLFAARRRQRPACGRRRSTRCCSGCRTCTSTRRRRDARSRSSPSSRTSGYEIVTMRLLAVRGSMVRGCDGSGSTVRGAKGSTVRSPDSSPNGNLCTALLPDRRTSHLRTLEPEPSHRRTSNHRTLERFGSFWWRYRPLLAARRRTRTPATSRSPCARGRTVSTLARATTRRLSASRS